MRRIHPRSAAALFLIIYYLLGLFTSFIFQINLFGYKVYIGIGIIIGLIVHKIFEKKYYDEKIEEEEEEKEFFKKALENRKKLENEE
ncbi:MAG: hypothetical protein K6A89_09865 [Treponema sp.]|nr:hypothetical protein [Treponema sp.]